MLEKLSVKGNLIKYDRQTLNQKIEDILNFRFGDLEKIDNGLDDLHDPYLLAGMKEAVERIKKAKQNNEKIIIFGDYDVDGVTSTSILMHFFKTLGMQVSYRLPHRVKDGYGLKNYFVDELKLLDVSLIITVDCGTKDIEVIKHAKNLGIDVIVTDHHVVPEGEFGDAVSVVNPKRGDCNYPYKNLSGAGVAFKLMSALAKEYFDNKTYKKYLKESIDIAAIGTVADCMELTGENRVIVREGLKQIRNSRSKGIRSLIADKINEDFDADIFSFTIGPKLNAAGRMDSPYKAINLILNSGESLNTTLREIEKLNEQRKYLSNEFFQDAISKINKNDNILFYISPAIDHGIIGIVAGRLTEQFYKPSIVLKDEGDKLVASARSPEYFSIVNFLSEFGEYFISFGGHNGAAGFSIQKEKFSEFKTKIINKINKINFSKYKKELNIDKVVKLEEIGFSFYEKINSFKPFGIGNTKPIFMVEKLDYTKIEFMGNSRDHIKFVTKHGFKIIGFFMGDYYEQIKRGKSLDIIFDINEDNWMGNRNLMLKIVDLVVE